MVLSPERPSLRANSFLSEVACVSDVVEKEKITGQKARIESEIDGQCHTGTRAVEKRDIARILRAIGAKFGDILAPAGIIKGRRRLARCEDVSLMSVFLVDLFEVKLE